MTERRLRAVKAGEKAPAKRAPRKASPKSVVNAAGIGDRRQLLVALQHRIATALDDPKTAGPALAALIKQQRDIAAEIHAIDLAARAGLSRSKTKSAIDTTPNGLWDEDDLTEVRCGVSATWPPAAPHPAHREAFGELRWHGRGCADVPGSKCAAA